MKSTKYTGKPWEAPNEDLITLCEWHHDEEHLTNTDSMKGSKK